MIGENIKKLRVSKGWTQKDLANKLFVTAQAISRWENNEVEPSATTLYEMSRIFEVSIDELFGKSAPAPLVEKELVVEKEYVYKEPQKIVAVCSQCGRAIYKEEDIVYDGIKKNSTAVCKRCYEKNETTRKEREKKELNSSISYGVKQRKKSFLWGSIITAIVLSIAIWFLTWIEADGGAIAIGIVFSILLFPFSSCLFLKNNFIGDMMMEIISWGFVKFPGIIFGLSLDGFIFFILVKLLFWLLGILLACAFTILAFLIGLIVSLFVYPFAIVKSIKHPEMSKKFF